MARSARPAHAIASAARSRADQREDYPQRTEWNVRDSDGTVVFSIAPTLTGGSKQTVELAHKHGKPVLHQVRHGWQEALALTPRCFVQAAHRLRGSLRRGLGQEFERPIQHGLGFVQLAIADQRVGLLHDLSNGGRVAPLLLPTADASHHPLPL